MKTWQEYYWSCTCDVEILALWIIYTPEVQLNRYQKPCRHILNEGTLKPKPSFWLVNFSECRDPVIWGVEILIQGIYESKRCFKRNAPLEHSDCWDCSLPHSFKYLEKLKQNKSSQFFVKCFWAPLFSWYFLCHFRYRTFIFLLSYKMWGLYCIVINSEL